MSYNYNVEKLDLAADLGLQAKFSYTNKNGVTRNRRLHVDEFDGDYVSGQSYDENGQPEGYRRFSLDSINDSVVIR